MDTSSVIEGTVKFRDGKKWKSRWCVMRKLSPVADCLHLQLYRDSKDRYKQGQTKASLSLQHFLGIESGFTLDKESNTIAILCQDVTVVLAFDTRERLIQWQVKIANNLGEDQQYLIQIASTPQRARIPPGPARIHVREFRFSLTTGVPPRLIGIWDIRQLRRYGVVDNRFCVEGGSSCGKGEGLYVFVTDQCEEISKTFKLASEGKLTNRRKTVSRNMSVMESPRRALQQRMHNQAETMSTMDTISAITNFNKPNCDSTLPWESSETRTSCDYGDTASVGEAADAQESVGWAPDIGIGRCSSCISKLHALSRSSTIVQTPSNGFTPAWTMEETLKSQKKDPISMCNTSLPCVPESQNPIESCCSCDSRSRVVSPCKQNYNFVMAPETKFCPCQTKSNSTPNQNVRQAPILPQYENYDVPRSIFSKLSDDRRIEESRLQETTEYYDTPKKIKEHLNIGGLVELNSCNECLPVHRYCVCQVSQCPSKVNGQSQCHCQRRCQSFSKSSDCERLSCVESSQGNNYYSNGAIYAKVDLLKKTIKSSETCKTPARTECIQSKELQIQSNYENLEFAQSLEHYENAKDFMVKLNESLSSGKKQACTKCPCSIKGLAPKASLDLDDYLMMGPICEREDKEESSGVPSYIPMNPVSSKSSPTKCAHVCVLNRRFEAGVGSSLEHINTAKSAEVKPILRKHDPNSAYGSQEGRNMAVIRRRSNSVDSGRCFDALECISERTSSSTHNTITANSATASIDSLPTENSDDKKPTDKTEDFESKISKGVYPLSFVQDSPCSIARRLQLAPNKSANNRDSSSSNDSGVSTGSLKHCGTEFLEFETLVTPLAKVRHHSVGNRELLLFPPRRSKSSDPLQDLSFKFEKNILAPKSSSAEAEIPVSPTKKELRKEMAVSCLAGGLTIPYMDSVSTSSGTSDMSDYIDTLSMSSYSSSETADNLRLCHSAATVLRPRSGKEYQKIDRYNIDDVTGKNSHKLSGAEHSDSPSLGYISSTSSN